MGIPSLVWFVIAAVALLLAAVLLWVDRVRGTGGGQDRKRWAALREWEYVDCDPVLPGRWGYGAILQEGPGVARHLASGPVPTPEGPRRAYVFDHEQAGRIDAVLAAVQAQAPLYAALELRLPSAPLPAASGLDLLEPLGSRYAFAADAEAVKPLLTERLAAASDAIGNDIELLWAEGDWVLAAAPADATPQRMQDLLADLAEVATALEQAQGARDPLGG